MTKRKKRRRKPLDGAVRAQTTVWYKAGYRLAEDKPVAPSSGRIADRFINVVRPDGSVIERVIRDSPRSRKGTPYDRVHPGDVERAITRYEDVVIAPDGAVTAGPYQVAVLEHDAAGVLLLPSSPEHPDRYAGDIVLRRVLDTLKAVGEPFRMHVPEGSGAAWTAELAGMVVEAVFVAPEPEEPDAREAAGPDADELTRALWAITTALTGLTPARPLAPVAHEDAVYLWEPGAD